MKQRLLIIYLVAAVFAVAVTLITRKIMQPGDPVMDTKVLIATRDLPVGTKVTSEDFIWQPWPRKILNAAYITEENKATVKDLMGSIVRYTVIQNEPVLPAKFVRAENKSLLAAIISPGKRAYTLQMGRTSNLTGLIAPGDLVDILAVTKNENSARDVVAQTIVHKVPVIAVDGRLTREASEKKIEPPEEVTIEVTPRQAEYLAASLRETKPTITVYSLTGANRLEPKAEENTLSSGTFNTEPEKKPVEAPFYLPPRKQEHTISIIRGSEKVNVIIPDNIPLQPGLPFNKSEQMQGNGQHVQTR